MNAFATEMREQPAALRDLANRYGGDEGRARLVAAARAISASALSPLLTGMGASYHAAAAMLPYWHALGAGGAVAEATDLLNYGAATLSGAGAMVYLSQSGRSAEVAPMIGRLPAGVPLVGITNDPDSPLGRGAAHALPLVAGGETYVACKTYVNSLALLWLLGREVAGATDGTEGDTLAALAGRIDALLAEGEATAARWLDTLADAPRLIFVGHGPHAFTARQCAMMAAEWAKRDVLFMGIGAFRHGFVEIVQPGDGMVVFAPPGPAAASARALADEIAGYGGRVLVVSHGETSGPHDAPATSERDEWLAPLLDVIPAQLFVHDLALRHGIAPGFRYIAKVTTAL